MLHRQRSKGEHCRFRLPSPRTSSMVSIFASQFHQSASSFSPTPISFRKRLCGKPSSYLFLFLAIFSSSCIFSIDRQVDGYLNFWPC